jgi:hypothetical protein
MSSLIFIYRHFLSLSLQGGERDAVKNVNTVANTKIDLLISLIFYNIGLSVYINEDLLLLI